MRKKYNLISDYMKEYLLGAVAVLLIVVAAVAIHSSIWGKEDTTKSRLDVDQQGNELVIGPTNISHRKARVARRLTGASQAPMPIPEEIENE